MKPPFLNSVRVRNFKAIRNSGSVRLTPLTVFIGNNGSGKSSLIEALETLQVFITRDTLGTMPDGSTLRYREVTLRYVDGLLRRVVIGDITGWADVPANWSATTGGRTVLTQPERERIADALR